MRTVVIAILLLSTQASAGQTPNIEDRRENDTSLHAPLIPFANEAKRIPVIRADPKDRGWGADPQNPACGPACKLAPPRPILGVLP